MNVASPAWLPARFLQFVLFAGYLLLLTGWVISARWPVSDDNVLVGYFGPLLLILVAHVGLAWVDARYGSGGGRPSAFATAGPVGGQGLVAPGRPWWRTDRPFRIFGAVLVIRIWYENTMEPDVSRWLAHSARAGALIGAVAALAVTVVVVRDIWHRADLVLSPEGLSLPGWRRRTEVRWDVLRSGPTGRRFRHDRLELEIDPPAGLGRRSRRRQRITVWCDRFAVAPAFLSGAIRHYLDHPEHRPVIGTGEEYVRLHVVLGRRPLDGEDPS
ncbi:hypothetical protein ACIBF5_13310 [Micromonospora sp. NPDC050417]|uniref:hypothetical protein n=1 Tax=Micromonospora sp. NPDC050417 TaxID=3364280 RepID=UPI00378F52E3